MASSRANEFGGGQGCVAWDLFLTFNLVLDKEKKKYEDVGREREKSDLVTSVGLNLKNESGISDLLSLLSGATVVKTNNDSKKIIMIIVILLQ